MVAMRAQGLAQIFSTQLVGMPILQRRVVLGVACKNFVQGGASTDRKIGVLMRALKSAFDGLNEDTRQAVFAAALDTYESLPPEMEGVEE